MRDDFCVFILTHGRPGRVYTWDSLDDSGYTGKRYVVCDDEDKTLQEYRANFDDSVLTFSKSEIVKTFDEGDNFNDRRAIIYARNACFELARQIGCKYFMQLDDDYTGFYLRYNSELVYGNTHQIAHSMDAIISSMIEFYIESGSLSVAMSQGGDHIGGSHGHGPHLKRKCMNSFICSTDREFRFSGRINEDVNTYTELARRGGLFLTVVHAQLRQMQTQSNEGGMTELYIDSGTYVKSFYSVMYCPSGVTVNKLQDPRSPHSRIHHRINWNATAPKILREEWRKQ